MRKTDKSVADLNRENGKNKRNEIGDNLRGNRWASHVLCCPKLCGLWNFPRNNKHRTLFLAYKHTSEA